MNRIIRQKKGFSLIEVLIGLIFLAIGLLAVAGMQATSVRGNFFSNNLMLATYAAQDRLEFLKNLPMTDSRPAAAAGAYNQGTTQVSTPSFKSLVFNRSYTVGTIAATNGDYLSIKYTVRWNDGVNHSLDFYTMRSQ